MEEKRPKMPQNANATKLNPKHAKFVAAMLKHFTLEAACKDLGISHETGRRYMLEASVRTAYEAELQALVNNALSDLFRLIGPAIAVLSKSLTDPDPNAIRLRAASIILEKTLDLRKLMDHEQRLTALEQQIQQGGYHEPT